MKRKLFVCVIGCFLLFLIAVTGMAEVKTVELVNMPLAAGRTSSYTIDTFQLICKRAGFNPKVTILPWKRAQETAMTGHNLVIMPLARLAERENKYMWISPMNKTELVFASINGKAYDLATAKSLGSVLVHMGTSYETFLIKSGFTNLSTTGDVDANAKKLANGRGDAWLTPITPADQAWAKGGYPQKLTFGPVVYTEEMWMAMSPGSDPTIAGALKKEFEAIKADGTFQKIYSTYMK